MVIEADQNAHVPHTEGDAETGMEMTVLAEMPEVPVEVLTVQVGLEVVLVPMPAMDEPVMAVAAVATVQEPVVTVAAMAATGQKHQPVRMARTGII